MSRVFTVLWILLIVFALFAGYVRLAPSDPSKWHQSLTFEQDRDLQRGVQRVIAAEQGDLERLHGIISTANRTEVLAGSVETGHVTYVSRTKLMAYPDYTTIEASDGQIRIFARSRFGRKDLGVNRARVTRWLNALKAG